MADAGKKNLVHQPDLYMVNVLFCFVFWSIFSAQRIFVRVRTRHAIMLS